MYHLYWLSDGCVVLILISISFWICGFVFSDFCSSTAISDCEFVIVDLPDRIILMLDNFLFCFVSSKLDWIFPSVSMMFLKIPDIFKVILDWICTSWIWMYSMMEILLISFLALKLSDLYLPLTFCDFDSGLYFHLDSSLGYFYLNFETHFGVGRMFH